MGRLAAKSVILELMSAGAPRPGEARSIVEACKLFGISENSARVTLARLVASGTLELASRGSYTLGAGTVGLTRRLNAWRTLDHEAVAWKEDWLCVFTAELSRTNRSELRRRERALRLMGFRELYRGLEIRPDNLRGGVDGVRERLVSLGFDEAAPVFHAHFDGALDQRARQLWDAKTLAASYRAMRDRLEAWLQRLPELDLDSAARESFLLGREALKQILFDPLLPDSLVDVDERATFVACARRFDAVGRRVWHRRFGVDRSLVHAADGDHAEALRARGAGELVQ